MKPQIFAMTLAALAFAQPACGQAANNSDTVSGVTIPANKPALRETPTEKENHRIVYEWTLMLMTGHAKEGFEKYVSPDFVDHSHIVRSRTKSDKAGYAEALAGFERMGGGGAPGGAPPAGGAPAGAPLKDNIRANDDMVINYGAVGADIFRVQNGKITDHWDATPMITVLLKSELAD